MMYRFAIFWNSKKAHTYSDCTIFVLADFRLSSATDLCPALIGVSSCDKEVIHATGSEMPAAIWDPIQEHKPARASRDANTVAAPRDIVNSLTYDVFEKPNIAASADHGSTSRGISGLKHLSAQAATTGLHVAGSSASKSSANFLLQGCAHLPDKQTPRPTNC
jgi:hypothetical protein